MSILATPAKHTAWWLHRGDQLVLPSAVNECASHRASRSSGRKGTGQGTHTEGQPLTGPSFHCRDCPWNPLTASPEVKMWRTPGLWWEVSAQGPVCTPHCPQHGQPSSGLSCPPPYPSLLLLPCALQQGRVTSVPPSYGVFAQAPPASPTWGIPSSDSGWLLLSSLLSLWG